MKDLNIIADLLNIVVGKRSPLGPRLRIGICRAFGLGQVSTSTSTKWRGRVSGSRTLVLVLGKPRPSSGFRAYFGPGVGAHFGPDFPPICEVNNIPDRVQVSPCHTGYQP